MRKIFVMSLLFTAILALAASGVVLAGWGERSEMGPEPGSFAYQEALETGSLPTGIVSEEMRSMEGVSSRETGPEPGSFAYQEALETGSLPTAVGLSSSEIESSVVTNEAPEFELGGFNYRIGVDTGE